MKILLEKIDDSPKEKIRRIEEIIHRRQQLMMRRLDTSPRAVLMIGKAVHNHAKKMELEMNQRLCIVGVQSFYI